MKRRVDTVSVEGVQERILTLRGIKVLLDADLARVYGRLHKAVERTVSPKPKQVSRGLCLPTYRWRVRPDKIATH
jgi:hypothetical protein